jgi:hypothetical protein
MILARNILKTVKLKDIGRFLSSKSVKNDRRTLIGLENGPTFKEFIQNNKSTESQSKSIDPSVEIDNKIFLENVKRINEQVEEEQLIDDHSAKKAVYFEIHGCQMNLNDTEVAYSILAQTGAKNAEMFYNALNKLF